MRARKPIYRTLTEIGDYRFVDFGHPTYCVMVKKKDYHSWSGRWFGGVNISNFDIVEKDFVLSGDVKKLMFLKDLEK